MSTRISNTPRAASDDSNFMALIRDCSQGELICFWSKRVATYLSVLFQDIQRLDVWLTFRQSSLRWYFWLCWQWSPLCEDLLF